MTNDAEDIERIFFPGVDGMDPIDLEAVCQFKYLGVSLNCSPRHLFKDFNEQVKKRAAKYVASVISLSRAGPDRSSLAYTLWTSVALPSILYGTEIIPLEKKTLDVLEKYNSQVGKFILQLPQSSANVSSHIDAGLKPVWAIIAEKSLIYARSVMTKDPGYWAKIAMGENIQIGLDSPYIRQLCSWMQKCGTTIQAPIRIKKAVKKASIQSILRQRTTTGVTCFAMNPPHSSSKIQSWFKPKNWISDSVFSKIIAQFRSCNSGLGNRAPAADGKIYKLCPLCKEKGKFALNNEVHLIIDCPDLELHRRACGLGPFIRSYRAISRSISSLRLYSLFLNDSHNETMQLRAADLYSMKVAWHSLTKIAMKSYEFK